MVPVLTSLGYQSRLKVLTLPPTLTYRRLRGDITNVYKHLHGMFTLSHDMFNHDLYEGTRGHYLKLSKDRSKREVRGDTSLARESLIHGIHFRTLS